MKTETFIRYRNVLAASAAALSISAAPAFAQTSAPIVQPGAPGQDTRDLSADEASKIADTRYTQDDVMFLQHMIPHHWQAVEMAALATERTNNQDILDAAGRITASQEDEIAFMQDWLTARGEDAPDPSDHHSMHMSMEMMRAMGMATPDQMEQLAASEGTAFDRLFLELMIKHHRGAVTMVDDLLDQPGSAYDPMLFDFVNDVTNDQTAEIERMSAILAGLSTDPRVGLSAGFRDAGEAISNMTLVAALPKPAGFFDPSNPAGLPPKIEKADEMADEEDVSEDAADRDDNEQSLAGTQWGTRSPLLSFSNTDMAFAGDKLVVGSYHGFNIYDLGEDGVPALYSSVVCPGGQGDVSVVGDLLIMSVEQTRGRVDCGLQGIAEDVSEERFRGLRIFDISDMKRPVQVGQVQTCRGSHTHSIVSADDETIVVYNSGTAGVRDAEELEGCIGYVPGDQRTALFRIDVIEIPVDNPAASRIVDSPAVFADEETGSIAGLWLGGDHGDDTQTTSQTNQCHDITVFPSANLAAGACSGNGIIFDISDPLNPTRIDAVTDEGFAYWHSATFNNDGTKVLFTDEWGGGARARCRSHDPMTWGADAIYDIEDGQLEFKGYYKMPAPQSEEENCVAHNGSIIPVPGRDIFVQSWYQGGLSIMDFTDSTNAQEIAFFDRGPIWDEKLVLGGYWSSYWYGDKIYATEIVRGLDVFSLEPSEYLTENEIAAAALADQGEIFNPQQQFPVTWPAVPVVARAYIDQLSRDEALSPELGTQLKEALDKADAALAEGGRDRQLATTLRGLADDLEGGEGMTAKRMAALSETLDGIAAELR
ncbi:DUF305 domain-containing protein [Aquisalinus flavus]|uniref:DUF305 domain-containing protein n=1 Tax=Aquisalinus flavus TaxID=1526572 RepID=A0A8J2V528_9PROT|nr:DUF305 domain-containing protein [Aquisalinus flavus]GGD07186.1 hypothetical protein GCM10011342_15000 [Aquisalinus flavus]